MIISIKEITQCPEVSFHQVVASSQHKVMPLANLEGPIKEGMKNRWRALEEFEIRDLGYYYIPNGYIAGIGGTLDDKLNLLYSRDLTLDKITPAKVKGFRLGEYDEIQNHIANTKEITLSPNVLINVCMPGMYIYGHWLIDVLPKLYLVKALLSNESYKILLPNDLPEYHKDFLNLLGIEEKSLLYFNPNAEIVKGRAVIQPLKCRIKDGSWLAPFIGDMYNEISDSIVSEDLGLPQKLYLSRRNLKKQFRKLVNREEVSELITAYGFEEIFPEDYSLQEQLQLYKNASIMVGEFGSALHNSLFATIKLKVISLQSCHVPLLVQWGICNIKGQSCSLIFGETTEVRKSINSDFKIDLSQLDIVLKDCCNLQ